MALGGLADVVGRQGVLDVGEDALLGGAGQLADAFKDEPGLARRAMAALLGCGEAENLRRGAGKGIGNGFDLSGLVRVNYALLTSLLRGLGSNRAYQRGDVLYSKGLW